MMPSLEKISYYVKFLDKVQDNLEKGGCYMQIVIDAKISIQNKKKCQWYEDMGIEKQTVMKTCYMSKNHQWKYVTIRSRTTGFL